LWAEHIVGQPPLETPNKNGGAHHTELVPSLEAAPHRDCTTRKRSFENKPDGSPISGSGRVTAFPFPQIVIRDMDTRQKSHVVPVGGGPRSRRATLHPPRTHTIIILSRFNPPRQCGSRCRSTHAHTASSGSSSSSGPMIWIEHGPFFGPPALA
jgi:hypothetical protein